ncbi:MULTISPECIES: phytanoyl-CoA dioxygenase family protein [Burkholderia]|uniref:phytanoyl-CoA dioxygenase family protein n=1 Tax=Burkholderia TaxID=32008 RepID=UPI0013C534C2|nr:MULTISPECIES: phytanoyl-CoA dioxygenase family protein [Burkholderia]
MLTKLAKSVTGVFANLLGETPSASRIEALKRQYDAEGFLILKDFFKPKVVEQIREQAVSLWDVPRNEKLIVDFGDGDLAGRRMRLADAPDHGKSLNHKINDFYLESDEFRSIVLDPKLANLLSALLEGKPSIINSLHFTVGSSQRPHVDTWYMPPGVEDRMAVIAVPLEQYTEENGPLFFYPKSHLIPKYRFSTGHLRAVPDEQHLCDEYLFGEVEKRGLKREIFYGGPGDLFIWHSQLLHGGMPITNPSKTRRSVVVHYWRQGDIDVAPEYHWLRGTERAAYGGAYIAREHQKVGTVG